MGPLPLKTGHLFLLGAFIMAIITGSVLLNLSKSKTQDQTTKPPSKTTAIVVAAQSVSTGTLLSTEHLRYMEWPIELLPKGHYFTSLGELSGRVAKTPFLAGEPIVAEKISGNRSQGGLQVLIPPGMRAVSVKVDEVKAVAGFVKPGDRVDVLAVFDVDVDKASGEDQVKERVNVVRTVIQNALVVAAAQSMVRNFESDSSGRETMQKPGMNSFDSDNLGPHPKQRLNEMDGVNAPQSGSNISEVPAAPEPKKSAEDMARDRREAMKDQEDRDRKARQISSVTLALTPEQVEALTLAEETGHIRLVLRNENDAIQQPTKGISSPELILKNIGPLNYSWNKLTQGKKLSSSNRYVGPQVEFVQGSNRNFVNF
ncbi:MAG: Flp pilus assembly protein CpaB [Cyanobacteria bacterium]|nr:Flp pilus assembly protein CpaB [Cyanobacteriota bacterium]